MHALTSLEPEEILASPDVPEAIKTEFRRQAWREGNLIHLTRPGRQRDLYREVWQYVLKPDLLEDPDYLTPFVFNMHRRLGKSYVGVLIMLEYAYRWPRQQVKFICGEKKQAAEVLSEHWPSIVSDCPHEMAPHKHHGDHFSVFNPRWLDEAGIPATKKNIKRYKPLWASQVKLYGTNKDKGNAIRGGSCDLAVFDECREFKWLNYIYGTVIMPMFKGRERPCTLMPSTPPDDPAHPWQAHYLPRAREVGKYYCCPADLNPDFTEREKDDFANEYGGRDSVTYRREIQCELIPDTSYHIVPEFPDADVAVPGELEPTNPFVFEAGTWETTDHYYAFEVADLGGTKDAYGLIFGYYDFLKAKLVVLEARFEQNLNTEELANVWLSCREKFRAHFKEDPIKTIMVADGHPQRLVDMRQMFDLEVSRAPRQDLEGNLHTLRAGFMKDEIRISSDARDLIVQLRSGTKDEKRRWRWSEEHGHFDLVAAMTYFYRVAMPFFDVNTVPPVRYNREDTFVTPQRAAAGGALITNRWRA